MGDGTLMGKELASQESFGFRSQVKLAVVRVAVGKGFESRAKSAKIAFWPKLNV